MAVTRLAMSRRPACGGCGTCPKCERAAYMRAWYRLPGNAERARASQRSSRVSRIEEVRAYDRARGYRPSAPEKERARTAVKVALLAGTLERQPCEVGVDCAGRIEAHHDDYSRPLNVRWLCRRHHGEAHRLVA